MSQNTQKFFAGLGVLALVVGLIVGLVYGVGAYNDSIRESAKQALMDEMSPKIRKADNVLAQQEKVQADAKAKLAEAEKATKQAETSLKAAEAAKVVADAEHKALVQLVVAMRTLKEKPASAIDYRSYDKTCELRYGWLTSTQLDITTSGVKISGTTLDYVRNADGTVVDVRLNNKATTTTIERAPNKLANY